MEPTSVFTELGHLKIPLEEILEATNNFADKNIIGKGGFGNVYKGQLTCSGKSIKIAARRLGSNQWQGDVEFWTEISILSTLKNDLLVSLVGYCDEKGEKIIITRRYPKGSLVTYLSDPITLDWKQRLFIATRLAGALHYIHEQLDLSYYVIHRNINSSTIVLKSYTSPKLSGFEHSIKHSVDRKNQILHCVAIGTQGYMDPATEASGGVTHKSDIYSLGIVLFEILCGRKANENNTLLGPLARFHYENGTLQEIIHPDLWKQMKPKSFKCFSEAAYSCLQDDQTQRPDAYPLCEKLRFAEKMQINDYEEDEVETDTSKMEKFFKIWSKYPSEMAEEASRETENLLDILSESPSQVKNMELWRIEIRDVLLAIELFRNDSLLIRRGYKESLWKAELECFNREHLLFVEGVNKDELVKKNYTAMIRMSITRIRYHGYYGKKYPSAEIEILSSCNHENIESFLGFSDTVDCIFIVSEFVSTSYLSDYLNDSILTWEKRLKICTDVACGLRYLHHQREDRKMVIHNDINSSNILLDTNNWSAKIVGFGRSVFLPRRQDAVSLQCRYFDAKNLYTDPESVQTGEIKRQSDIFSFGVVMLEILCGMSASDLMKYEGLNDKDVAHLAQRWFDKGITKRKVTPIVNGRNAENKFSSYKGANKDSLDTFMKIMYECLAPKQNQRPMMKVVIEKLKKAFSFQENKEDIQRMSFQDIKLATQNFNHAIGEGGSGKVFKGEVSHEHGNGFEVVVAKMLDKSQCQGEKQFHNELQILSEFKHDNVVGLVSYNNETDEKIIIYEYASNGSLDKHLDDARLTWMKRLNICIDVATGLDFLHGGLGGQEVVIHRDIKSANILLFDDWKAKLGDFGLSLISTINKDSNYAIDYACGTPGYVDPLYLKSSLLTIESDIFSFGVVLFEILCGRAIYTIPEHERRSLLSFIKHKFEEGKQNVVFKAIKEEIVSKSLTVFMNIVYKCLDDDRKKRPTSKEILLQLNKALEFQEKFECTLRMSFQDIKLATQNFSHAIGEGGFGRVFKGEVAHEHGNGFDAIVAKKFDKSKGQGEKQFYNELQILYACEHESVIGLVGYCNETDEKIIINEYACNGSLERHLDDAKLTWKKRLNICIDVAAGLDFLHGGLGGQEVVIHRDIKSANILLFDDWKAKLGDFGLSSISTINKDSNYAIDYACGTPGYVDPLYLKSSLLTIESDIFSFGVVLFEILCGRAIYTIPEHERRSLLSFIKHKFEERKQNDVVFKAIKEEIVSKSLTVFMNIVYKCLDDDREKRPTSKEVFVQLNKALEFQEEEFVLFNCLICT